MLGPAAASLSAPVSRGPGLAEARLTEPAPDRQAVDTATARRRRKVRFDLDPGADEGHPGKPQTTRSTVHGCRCRGGSSPGPKRTAVLGRPPAPGAVASPGEDPLLRKAGLFRAGAAHANYVPFDWQAR
eukprot:9527489-Alexandrium_andersonii.AAC.1